LQMCAYFDWQFAMDFCLEHSNKSFFRVKLPGEYPAHYLPKHLV
jgi:hypothetical protein